MSRLVEPLSKVEAKAFKHCEEVVERSQKGAFEWGEALTEIRDKRYYRETYSTFEAYCNERWQFGRHYANRLIQAVLVVESMVPTGTIPVNERQARVLATLPQEERAPVLQQARQQAKGKEPTADEIEQVIAEQFAKLPPEKQRERIESQEREVHARYTNRREQESKKQRWKKIQKLATKLRKLAGGDVLPGAFEHLDAFIDACRIGLE